MGDKNSEIDDEQEWNCVFLFGVNEKCENQNIVNVFLTVASRVGPIDDGIIHRRWPIDMTMPSRHRDTPPTPPK